MSTITLSDQQLDRLADRVADRVVAAVSKGAETSHQLVDAATLAAELHSSRAFVYEHAAELGAIRIGNGPKPRLRFDVEVARRALAKQAETNPSPAVRPPHRRAQRTSAGSVLAVRPIGGKR